MARYIDADDAIYELERAFPADDFGKIIRCISRTPTANVPERNVGKWVPVSERLPEDLEEVNVTWVNHDPEPYYSFAKDKPLTATAVYYKEKWYWSSSTCVDVLAEYGRNEMDKIDDGIEVVAWMPLPEPYKEDKNDGEIH